MKRTCWDRIISCTWVLPTVDREGFARDVIHSAIAFTSSVPGRLRIRASFCSSPESLIKRNSQRHWINSSAWLIIAMIMVLIGWRSRLEPSRVQWHTELRINVLGLLMRGTVSETKRSQCQSHTMNVIIYLYVWNYSNTLLMAIMAILSVLIAI